MSSPTSPHKLSTRQLSVAAENIAAAQFSLYGFDVLDHAGRARFVYDLGVAKSGGMMKVMVRGSVNGFWNLIQPYLEQTPRFKPAKADYHRAIDMWLEHHSSRVTCCLVKFESADLHQMPRIYLASAFEIAEKLHEITEHIGESSLCEEYEIIDSSGARKVESLPSRWLFSQSRLAELMKSPQAEKPLSFRVSSATERAARADARPEACAVQ